MGRRKGQYKPKTFESTGKSNDTSANIYESMLLSPAFMDLSNKQKLLYLYMKKQYYGHRKPSKDFPDVPKVQDDTCFYFNLSVAVDYGIYTRNNKDSFYKDIKSIERHGFIETVSNGKITKTRSIYRLSDAWQSWTS